MPVNVLLSLYRREENIMSCKSTPEQRNERLRSFVIAARELIEQNDFSNISIRKIAEKAGFHNSTLYSYFKDAEYLLSLASVNRFNQYSHSLAELSLKNLSEQERFYEIWHFFCLNAFKFPEIYNNFFFGKHSGNLTAIFKEYYTIFPDEDTVQSRNLYEIYLSRNISTRCLETLKPLINLSNTRLDYENIATARDLIISYLKSLLGQALTGKKNNFESDINELTKQFMTALQFIVYK